MQGTPRGLREKWAFQSSSRLLGSDLGLQDDSSHELGDELQLGYENDDEPMEEDVDLTMSGELEIDVPHATWPASQLANLPSPESRPLEDLQWLDHFARDQARLVVRTQAAVGTWTIGWGLQQEDGLGSPCNEVQFVSGRIHGCIFCHGAGHQRTIIA